MAEDEASADKAAAALHETALDDDSVAPWMMNREEEQMHGGLPWQGPALDTSEWNDIPEGAKFEFLDHTADVQLHSWGDTLEESFEQVATAMFAYMTEIEKVEKLTTISIEAEGDDILSLVFHYLDEFLFVFSAEPFFIPREVKIDKLDLENFTIKATGYGETFDLMKHPQGTEVKAITYSNMQVHQDKDTNDIYVIIDI